MQQAITKFTRYEFTEQEFRDALTFTDVQRAYLQTMLAEKAEERLALEVNTAAINVFIQDEAYLKGQMELLTVLLLPPPKPAA